MNKKILTVIIAIMIVMIVGFVMVPKDSTKNNIQTNGEIEKISGDSIISGDVENEDKETNLNEEVSGEISELKIQERVTQTECLDTFFQNEKFNLESFVENIDNTKINRKDDEKEIIYTKNFKYLFHGGEAESIIPVLNIDSEEADKINKTIEDEMYNYYSIDFKATLNDNVLSLMTYGDAEESMIEEIYHINIYNGNSVTNEELLESRNINSVDLLNELPNIVEKAFNNRTDYIIQTDASEVEDSLNKTISNLPKNVEDLELYLNEDTVNVVVLMHGSLHGYVEYYAIQIK